jgi:selenocysteine lyase/cysteine desulfurase
VSYLDHTGSTLYPEGLVQAISADLNSQLYGNPHAHNSSSRLSSEIVEQTREKVLSYFNTDSSKYHLVFTSGATGGLKILAQCFQWSPNAAFAYFAESHTSILGIRQLASISGAKIIPITKNEVYSVNITVTKIKLVIILDRRYSKLQHTTCCQRRAFCLPSTMQFLRSQTSSLLGEHDETER